MDELIPGIKRGDKACIAIGSEFIEEPAKGGVAVLSRRKQTNRASPRPRLRFAGVLMRSRGVPVRKDPEVEYRTRTP